MNYYPRYPGDYLAKTIDLTMVEDGAYTRLIDWYYANEQPVPHVRRYVVARATTAPERRAVDEVLQKFFTRDVDAHRHQRIDEEIAKAAPRIEAAKANGAKGGRRPKTNPPDNPGGNPSGNPPGSSPDNLAGTRWVTQRASSPEPYPEPEYRERSATPPPRPPAREAEPPEPTASSTPGGLACLAIKAAGIAEVNPGHPDLLRLLAAGVTAQELADTATELVGRGKPKFALLLATVEGRRRDAAARGALPAAPDAQPAGDDWTTRRGVEAIAMRLGQPTWDECVPFEAYRGRIRHAAKAAEQQAHAA